MQSRWRIRLFGPLRAESAERVITRFRTEKTALFLAYLAYHRHLPHPRETLLELLWPEEDPETSRVKLRIALSSLRRQLEPPGASAVLVADRASIQLNPIAATTDVAEFEAALAAAARAGSDLERMQLLTEAAELYTGELLPGWYEEWILRERERLGEAYLQALQQLVALLAQGGDLPRALDYALRAVSADPLREPAQRDLIRLLAASGQPAAAARQYRKLQRLLREELDTTPSRETRALMDQLRARHTESTPQPTPSPTPAPPAGPQHPAPNTQHPSSLTAATLTLLMAERVSPPSHTTGDMMACIAEPSTWVERLAQELCSYGGHIARQVGDATLAVFPRATEALQCAVAAQRALRDCGVRMALHTGEVDIEETEYRGVALDHVASVLRAGHGGQILCSEATAGLLRVEGEPGKSGFQFVDLGLYRLRNGVPGATAERLFQVSYPGMPQREFPPLKAEGGYAAALPLQFTRFFGREEEIAALGAMLLSEEIRLVTLTGPGGSGKTRLALEVASRLVEALRAAVWFVPLVDRTEARQIGEALASALRLPKLPGEDPLDQAVELLSRQPSLLLLDNFEHLVSEGAGTVRALLARVPTLTCLVTSRQLLNLPGEREFQVPPLPVPGVQVFRCSGVQEETVEGSTFNVQGLELAKSRPTPNTQHPTPRLLPEHLNTRTPEHLIRFAGVQLFVDRAQAARPDFQVTPGNAAAVAELCDRLEGIPLALELAAARALVLTPAQMLAQLDRRLDFLVSRQRGADSRHQTLRMAIDWSYQLLSPELQQFFRRLAVFRGGWSLEAAEAVCSGVQVFGCSGVQDQATTDDERPMTRDAGRETRDGALDALQQLRECSLIVAEPVGDEIRYRFLETLREYAWEQLVRHGETEDVRRRHFDFFARLAAEARRELYTEQQVSWLDRLQPDLENLRAALEWSLTATGCAAQSIAIAEALPHFWRARGPDPGLRGWLEELVARYPDAPSAARASLLFEAGKYVMTQGEYSLALRYYEESLTLQRQLGDRLAASRVLALMGETAIRSGEYARAEILLQESLVACRELDNWEGLAYTLSGLGHLAWRQGDLARATALAEECLALNRAAGLKTDVAGALGELGFLVLRSGDVSRATELFEEELALYREMRAVGSIACALWHLGMAMTMRGELHKAGELLEESVALYRESREMHALAQALSSLATVAGYCGDFALARSICEESLAIRRQLGDAWQIGLSLDWMGWTAFHEGDDTQARSLYTESLAHFRHVGDRRGIASALAGLGRIACRQGDTASARRFLVESLELRQGVGDRREIADGLEAMSTLRATEGDPERAATLAGAAAALREAIGCPIPPASLPAWEKHLTALRATLGEERFLARWEAGRTMELEAAVVSALEDDP